LSDDHRAALEYDWRHTFGLPFSEVGKSMEYGEAVRLVGLLAGDPSTRLAAALNEWTAPRSLEWLVLADLFDAFVRANYKQPQRYPRPFLDGAAKHRGKTDLPRADVIDLLNRHGHQFDPETQEE
jgi:hypothetical protein